MSDQRKQVNTELSSVDELWVDMGDGTHARGVYNRGPGGGGGGGAVTLVDGADVTQGAKANTAASWYDSVVSIVSLLKLLIASSVDAGSHVYGYTAGNMTTDAWTLFGTTRTKTYTWTAGVLTAESDWV